MNANKRIITEIDRITALAQHYADIIDGERYATVEDRVKSYYTDEDNCLFPSARELAALGLSIESIAFALLSRKLSAARLAELVREVEDGRPVTQVNQVIYRLRPLETRRETVLNDDVLAGLGLETDLLDVCLGRTLTLAGLAELVRNVCLGWTTVEDANTGLLMKVDEAREFRVAA